MDKFIVNGGNQISGKVDISGAKNAVLPLMTAALLVDGKTTINSVPNLRDTRTMIKLVETIEESDICLLPMDWHFYIKTNQTNIAEKFIRKAQNENKKIIVSVRGDYYASLPNYDNIIDM